ncbi:MAG: hypothetical protein II992_12500 [Lachnospiraceae bacterium]|nr:hypothetical protein [Lachnospiraceae bacterium]
MLFDTFCGKIIVVFDMYDTDVKSIPFELLINAEDVLKQEGDVLSIEILNCMKKFSQIRIISNE